MAKEKYEKYYLSNPMVDFSKHYPLLDTEALNVNGMNWGVPYYMNWHYLDKPFLMITENHTHDFDQFLVFMGGDPKKVREFDAEIEMHLGPEQERHIINTTTVLHIPKGMYHCPLNFKVINKPIMFLNIALTDQYVRKPGSKKGEGK